MDVEDGTCGFDTLFTSVNMPHILEKIFFSLDYDSLKACRQVNGAWRQLLSSDKYQRMYQEMSMKKRKNEHNICFEGKKVLPTQRIPLALAVKFTTF